MRIATVLAFAIAHGGGPSSAFPRASPSHQSNGASRAHPRHDQSSRYRIPTLPERDIA